MKEELHILWTSGSKITAERMVFMYAHNSIIKGWWDDVTVIIWGASASLVVSDSDIQDRIRGMIADGVRISACRACAEQLGVESELEMLGIDVIHWGAKLTEILKDGRKLITV